MECSLCHSKSSGAVARGLEGHELCLKSSGAVIGGRVINVILAVVVSTTKIKEIAAMNIIMVIKCTNELIVPRTKEEGMHSRIINYM